MYITYIYLKDICVVHQRKVLKAKKNSVQFLFPQSRSSPQCLTKVCVNIFKQMNGSIKAKIEGWRQKGEGTKVSKFHTKFTKRA